MRYKPSDAKDVLDLLVGVRELRQDNPGKEKKTLDAIALLSLPEHLRKTAIAIHKIGRATAAMIAGVTGRDARVECSNLEELAEMGYLEIEKRDGGVFFYIAK